MQPPHPVFNVIVLLLLIHAHWHAPIISAGTAAVTGGQWQQNLKLDGVSILATYGFLRAHALDNLVDGYGVHDYSPVVKPGDKAATAQPKAYLEQSIFPQGNAKPYWLTEWGFPSVAASSAQYHDRARSLAVLACNRKPLFKPAIQIAASPGPIRMTMQSGPPCWFRMNCSTLHGAVRTTPR